MSPRLEREQEELLAILCEASRRQAHDDRQEFIAVRMAEGHLIRHPRLPGVNLEEFHWGDLQILVTYGFLSVVDRHGDGSFTFDVGPSGFDYWESLRRQADEAPVRLETEIRRYLDSRAFSARYGTALARWTAAESLLWGADSLQQATTIGHLCREAMQEFAAALNISLGVAGGGSTTRTVDRIRDGLASLKEHLPRTLHAFLDAHLAYWGTVSDLVQRQEHGAEKEGEALGWEDSRLVVFQTALVMFELARAADRAR